MRASASAPTLPSLGGVTLGKNLGKPRSLVVPRGAERTWSSPALAGAYSLRKYAIALKHIPGERAPRSFAGDPLELPIEKIDLIGGNGKWRQLKAQEEFKQRRLAEEEEHRQELIRAAEKKRRQVELAERKRRHQEEEERRWQEEREQKRKDQEERVRVKREKAERVRVDTEQKEEERRRRMPRICETCEGSKKCQECAGKGYVFCVFLIPKVNTELDLHGTPMDRGRVLQGCDNCGGYRHNMLGELKKGSGECPACQGQGKIWPYIEPRDEPQQTSPKSRTMTMTSYQGERTGEVKVI